LQSHLLPLVRTSPRTSLKGGQTVEVLPNLNRGTPATDKLVLSLSARHVMQDGGHRIKHSVIALPEDPWRTTSVPINGHQTVRPLSVWEPP
jgi:hypothetical protein